MRKRSSKSLLAAILALLAACCIVIAAACTLTGVEISLDGDEGITFLEEDNKAIIGRGRTLDVERDIPYTLDVGYSIESWTLEVDGEETDFDGTVRIAYGRTYSLYAHLIYTSNDIAISAEGQDGITINTSVVNWPVGGTFDVSEDLPEGCCTLETGYTLTGWTLYTDGAAQDLAGAFLVEKDVSYVLVPSVDLADITVRIESPSGEALGGPIVQKYGTTLDLGSINYTPPKGYELTGWTLTIDGEPANDRIQDGSITLNQLADYVLTPVLDQVYIYVTLSVSEDSSSFIQILEESIRAAVGSTVDISAATEKDITYAVSYGYEVTWSLLVNGEKTESFNGTFAVEKGGTYELVASASPVDVTVTVNVTGVDGTEPWTVTKSYGDTFSIAEDIEYVPETGYEVKGYKVQEGDGTARTLGSGETEFAIESTDGYTVTIEVGYIELAYTLYRDDGETVIETGTTHYMAEVDLSNADLSWIEEPYALGYWEILIRTEDGEITGNLAGDTLIVREVGTFHLTAKLIDTTLNLIIYEEEYEEGKTDYVVFSSQDDITLNEAVNLSDISYTPPVSIYDGDYELVGWKLIAEYVDDTSYTNDYGLDGSFTITRNGSYHLYPILNRITVSFTISASEDDADLISVSTAEDSCLSGEDYSVEGIEYEMLDSNYALSGWTLVITDSEGNATTQFIPADGSFVVKAGSTYSLVAAVEQVRSAISLGVSDGSAGQITIADGASITKDVGSVFDVSADIADSLYAFADDYSYGYVVSWILTVDGVETAMEGGTFTVEAGKSYELLAVVSPAEVNITVIIEGVAADGETITRHYGDTFSLTDASFDVSEYTGYEIKGYTVQHGSSSESLDADAASFTIDSTDDYTLTISVGYTDLTYSLYQENRQTLITSGTTHYEGTIDLSGIEYTPAETDSFIYELDGWQVYVYDGSSYEYLETISANGSIEAGYVRNYVLIAVARETYAKVSVSVAEGYNDYIVSVTSEPIAVAVGESFDTGTDAASGICEARYGYNLVWSLMVDGAEDASFDGSFTVEKGNTYKLVVSTEPKTVTINIEVSGVEATVESVTKNFGDTFSLTDDVAFDVSNYTGYEIKGYSLQIGEEEAKAITEDFRIDSIEDYTLTVSVDYIVLSYTFYDEDGTTVVASGTTHYGDALDLSAVVYTPPAGWSLSSWIAKVDGTTVGQPSASATAYEITQVGTYTFTAVLLHDELHVVAYTDDSDSAHAVYTNNHVYVGDTIEMSSIDYTPEEDAYGTYELTGWKLYIDEEYSRTIDAAGSLYIDAEASYVLIAVTNQITARITLSADESSGSIISFTSGQLYATLMEEGGTTFTLSTGLADAYSLTDSVNYSVSWTLKTNGETADDFDGSSFAVAKGTTYELIAAVTRIPVDISLAVKDGEEGIISIDTGSSITVESGVEFSVSGILCSMLDSNYELAGWTWYVDGAAQGETVSTDGTVTATAGHTYTLEAAVVQVRSAISLGVSSGSTDCITITEGASITKNIGDSFDVSTDITSGMYAFTSDYSYGYVVSWTLTADGVETAMTDGTFTVEAGNAYELLAVVSPAQVNITVTIDGVPAGNETIIKSYGETFSLTDDVTFDVGGYTGYEIKGYSLQIGTGSDDAITEDFRIESIDDYTLTISVGYIDLTYIIYQADGTTEITSGTTYYGDEITITSYEPAEDSYGTYEVSGWTVYIGSDAVGADIGNITTYTIGSVADYRFVAQTEQITAKVILAADSDSAGLIDFSTSVIYKAISDGSFSIDADITAEMYELTNSTDYEISGWTLYENGFAAEMDNGSFTIAKGTAYQLQAAVERIPVAITIEAGDDNGAIISVTTATCTAGSGTDYSVSVIEYMMLNSNYQLAGWKLYIDGSAQEGTVAVDGSFTVTAGKEYKLEAVVERIPVTISIEANTGDSGRIEIVTDSATVDSGLEYTIPTGLYTITDTNYEVTGWLLYTNGSAEADSYNTGDSFTVTAGNTYKLVPVVSQIQVEITITSADGQSSLITITTESATVGSGDSYSVSNIEYSTNENYQLTGWTLYIDNEAQEGAIAITGSVSVSAGHSYKLEAVVERIPVEISIEASSEDSDRITITTSSDTEGSGLEYTISDSLYVITNFNYEVTGWLLYINGSAEGISYSTGSSFPVSTGNTYRLVPVVEGVEVTILIQDGNEGTLGSYTSRVGNSATVADIVADASEYIPAEWHYQDGWVVAIGDSSSVVKADEADTATVEITDSTITYLLTPYLVEYGKVTVTLEGMTANKDKITLGSATDHYDGETYILVGESYELPVETSEYILSLASTYGIKGWALCNEDGDIVATYDNVLVGVQDVLTLESGGAYTLVPIVDHYYTVNLADGVDGFGLTEIRVYDSDEDGLVLPLADSAYITDNSTGRTLVGWYLETEDGEIITAEGGASGIYNLGAAVGAVTGNLIVWPVLADTDYPLSTNGNWLDIKGSTIAMTDHAGTVLGVDSYTDVWHYISDTYMYDKEDNVADYTIINVASDTGLTKTLVSGYWFRLNTSAEVTLVQGSYYDIYFALTNFSSQDITLTLYVCTNGYLGTSDTSTSSNHTDGYTVTILAGDAVEFAFYGFQETVAVNTSQNNFITVIQLESQCTEMALGVRINVTEEDTEAKGTVYVQAADGIAFDTSEGEWTSYGDWLSKDYSIGESVQLADGSNYSLDTDGGYILLGWYMLDNNGNVIGNLQDTDFTFTLTSSAVYLKPYVLLGSEAYGHVSLTADVTGVTLDASYADGTNDYFSFVDNAAAVLPAAEQVNYTGDNTLTGWYVETEAGDTVGFYDLGGSVPGMTTNLVIWPVFGRSFFKLEVNDGNTSSTSDVAGTTLGTNGGSSYTALITSTNMYNKVDLVKEYTITNASGQTLPEGYWFRTNTFVTSGSCRSSDSTEVFLEGGLVSGHYYNIYYALTNYGDIDITFTIYHCTNGYFGTGSYATNNYVQQEVTIKPGETVYVSFMDFCEKNTNANNFITIYQLSDDCSDFQLGMRIWIEEEPVSVNIEPVDGFTLTNTDDWSSMTAYKTSTITVPVYGEDFTISSGYVFLGWYIVDNNGNILDFIEDGGSFTVSDSNTCQIDEYYQQVLLMPYVITEDEATKTITIDSSVDSSTFSLTSGITFQIGSTSSAITLPTADDVSNDTGRTLSGWYVEDSQGNIFGTSANGVYDLGAEFTVDAFTDSLVIWPVLSDDTYQLEANGYNRENNHVTTDESGTVFGSYDRSNNLNSSFSDTEMYNKTDNVLEYVVLNKNSGGSLVPLSSGSWFRFNTYAASVTDGHLNDGSYYNFYYAVTNYSDTAITITIYHCTNSYGDSGTYGMVSRQVTIQPQSTEYVLFAYFCQPSTSSSLSYTENFITVIELNQDVDTLMLGVRIQAEDFTAGTVSAAVRVDAAGYDFTVSGWTTDGYYAGSTCYVPASSEYANDTGMTLSGWEYYDENGSLVETVEAEGSFVIQSTAVVLVPVFTDSADTD
ncbi:MAG: hypothetical protein LUE27_03335 [Clostridia bacterium]|nr:hypothetical protein [Clostridia bacterium]